MPLVEPLSPELVLVTPELAKVARLELPPVRLFEDTLASLTRPTVERSWRAPQAEPPAAVRRRHTRPALMAAAASLIGGVILVAYVTGLVGAGQMDARLEPALHSEQTAAGTTPARSAEPRQRSAPASPAPKPNALHPNPTGAVPNVLGVIVTAGNGFVRLEWQRPRGVDRVEVLRFDGKRSVKRYNGRARSFVDRSVRDGHVYRYLLLSYDSAGRSSSGVTTVIRSRRA